MFNWSKGVEAMWAIARLTCREVLHRKIFHMVVLMTIGFLALYGTALYYYYKDPISDPVVRNVMATQLNSLGLYLGSFIIAFLAILGSIGAISSEAESGIIQAILVKPIKRQEVVFGKFLGLSFMIIIYSCIFFIAVVGLNLILSKGIVSYYFGSLLKALIYFAVIPLILIAVSLWGSTFLSTLSNGVMVVMLYSFATIGGFLEQVGRAILNATLINIGIISSMALPVDAIYRKMLNTLFSASPGDANILWDTFFTGKYEPSIWMLCYTVLYVVFFLWRAASIFNKKDI